MVFEKTRQIDRPLLKPFNFFRILKILALSLILALSTFHMSTAETDDDEPKPDFSNTWDFQRLSGMESRLTPHGNNLMGDMIDNNTGGISFEHTDISIPGNSKLEVAFRRKITQGLFGNTPFQQGFGDWVIDLPIAHVAYAPNDGTPTAPVFNNGCLTNSGPMGRTAYSGGGAQASSIPVNDWVHRSGLILHVPGEGLSGHPSSVTSLSDPKTNWKSGPQSTDYAGRCATAAIAPDGTQYKFGLHTFRKAAELPVPYEYTLCTGQSSNCTIETQEFYLHREYAVYLITEVEDIYGNWVRYEYTNDSRAELTRIHSNDLREILISYDTIVPPSGTRNSRYVSHITVNDQLVTTNRVWNYEYAGSGSIKALHKVILPDDRFWRLGNAGSGMNTMGAEIHPYYKCLPYEYTFDLKHPDGAVGTFELIETRHIKGATWLGDTTGDSISHYMEPMNIPHATSNTYCNGTPAGVPGEPKENIWDRKDGWPIYRTMSIASKTISGNDIPAASWDFEYRNYDGGALDNNWTEITGPDGTKRTYTYEAIGYHFGLLKSVNVVPLTGSGEIFTYEHVDEGFSSCAAEQDFGDNIAERCMVYTKRPVSKVI